MPKKQRIHLIQIFGLDQPGVMAGVTDLLTNEQVVILDVGQSVIHSSLSLGLLVHLRPSTNIGRLDENLQIFLTPIGLQVVITEVSDISYEAWVNRGGQMRHIITVLADPLTAEQLHAISNVCARHQLNIDRMRRLSGRLPLQTDSTGNELHCVEIAVQGVADRDSAELRAEWLQISEELGLDISVQADNVFRRHRRLVAFDMDSTLLNMEVIDELADRADVATEVRQITEAAMRGEMDFAESLQVRTKMLKGLPMAVLEDIARNMPLTVGAERLVRILRHLGYKVVIISGGFDYFASQLGRKLKADHVFANKLETKDGVVTGKIQGRIVDRFRKAELLREVSRKEGIAAEQVIAVGDGANDIEMLAAAGLGIAYRAKPIVTARSRHSLSQGGLDTILFLLGISHQELDSALKQTGLDLD